MTDAAALAAQDQPEDEAAIDLAALLAVHPVDPNLTACRACLRAKEDSPRVLAITGDGDFPALAAQHWIAKHDLNTEGVVAFPTFTVLVPRQGDVLAHNEFWVEARTA